jgi:hypothetical protein
MLSDKEKIAKHAFNWTTGKFETLHTKDIIRRDG